MKKTDSDGTYVIIVAALLFAWFVWPTPYAAYRDAAGRLDSGKRVSRITGAIQVRLLGTGMWVDQDKLPLSRIGLISPFLQRVQADGLQ